MKLHTAAETVSFVKELEEKSAKFFEEISQRHPEDQDLLRSFAKENRNYIAQIQRAYYSVITDAIEGGYAFDLDTDEYTVEATASENTSYSEALERALEMEEKILNFYTLAAEQSGSLMADVPRNFKIVAKKRRSRIPIVESLLEKSRSQQR